MKLKNFLIIVFMLAIGGLFVACNDAEVAIILDADFNITEEDTVSLDAKVIGLDEYELEYLDFNDTIISVSSTGEVVALKAGSTTITIGIKDYPDVTTSIDVTVKAKVELDDFAPTAITITGSDEVVVNATVKLTATVVPESANAALVWESDDLDVVAVTSDGTLLGKGVGSAKITAKSAIKDTVKGEFTVTVVAAESDEQIVNSAIDFLIAELPEYVHESFDLPVHPNPLITVEWKNNVNQVKTEYEFSATRDGVETISLKVAYGDAQSTKSVQLKLVVDLENNMHENLPLAVAAVDAYMAAVKDDVAGDLLLYPSVLGVNIVWATNNKNVITDEGAFVKPDNDTVVELTASFGHSGVAKVVTYNVTAIGFTQEEKVNYIINEGALKPFIDIETSSNVPLPGGEDRFGAKFTWVSGNPAVANNDGSYANLDLDVETTVKFTVTIEYDVAGFDFEEEFEIEITYKPLDDVGRAVIAFLASDFELPKQVVFGSSDIISQLTDLPTTLAEHDGISISWYGKEGEFDAEMNVLVPRVLYTPTEVYAKFSKEGLGDAVVALPINIGILTGENDFAFTVRTPSYAADLDQKQGMPAAEGGVGTVYALGFESFYFKSTFTRLVGEEQVTKTWYHFFAPGNVKEYKAEHLKDVDGKNFVDKTATDAVLAPQWGSTTRFFKNTTDGVIYIHKDDVVTLGAQAGSEAYKPFVIDATGKVVVVATPAMAFSPEGFIAYEIPVGGMLVCPGYLEAAVNVNLHYFGDELDRQIDVVTLTGWGTYTVPVTE